VSAQPLAAKAASLIGKETFQIYFIFFLIVGAVFNRDLPGLTFTHK